MSDEMTFDDGPVDEFATPEFVPAVVPAEDPAASLPWFRVDCAIPGFPPAEVQAGTEAEAIRAYCDVTECPETCVGKFGVLRLDA